MHSPGKPIQRGYRGAPRRPRTDGTRIDTLRQRHRGNGVRRSHTRLRRREPPDRAILRRVHAPSGGEPHALLWLHQSGTAEQPCSDESLNTAPSGHPRRQETRCRGNPCQNGGALLRPPGRGHEGTPRKFQPVVLRVQPPDRNHDVRSMDSASKRRHGCGKPHESTAIVPERRRDPPGPSH